MGLVHHVVCLLTPQLLLVLINRWYSVGFGTQQPLARFEHATVIASPAHDH